LKEQEGKNIIVESMTGICVLVIFSLCINMAVTIVGAGQTGTGHFYREFPKTE